MRASRQRSPLPRHAHGHHTARGVDPAVRQHLPVLQGSSRPAPACEPPVFISRRTDWSVADGRAEIAMVVVEQGLGERAGEQCKPGMNAHLELLELDR